MKKITLISTLIILAISPFGDGSLLHGHDDAARKNLLDRLAVAPGGCDCSDRNRVENAVLASPSVALLGKVEFAMINSTLSTPALSELSDLILRSHIPLGPDSLIAILGYTDRTGLTKTNYLLSRTRAEQVQNHLEELNLTHRLGIKTAIVPMGEEVQLCRHGLGHNRVAEIWLINTQPVWNPDFAAVHLPQKPVSRHGAETQIVQNRNIAGRNVITVPVGSVIYENGKTYVVGKNSSKRNFERWEVGLGRSDGYYVEALHGVFPGDILMVNR
jgi:outer membrane protein OmpA-like peptidoglycan-associated protein